MENFNWREKLDQLKVPIGLSLVGLVLILGGIFSSGLSKSKPKDPSTSSFPKESLIENQKIMSVDVSGSVKEPGVYQLKNGSRIEDAVKAAGGFNEDANKEYVSKYLNMAQKLSDGSKVYVPSSGEQASGVGSSGTVAGAGVDAKVNINTASQAELEALDGIASSRASNIISDRPYSSVDDLLSKKILPKAVFEKIKDQLVVY
ncbi:MAG: ComEA family DNA-binding protein [Candidatus Daviesbacteria bacterium]|nr:ComEA family DNA-binding protein [Candidatus Daviesbacteria bacterium]